MSAFVAAERSNGRLRDQLLHEALISTFCNARQQFHDWSDESDHYRPYFGLRNMTSAELMARETWPMRVVSPRE